MLINESNSMNKNMRKYLDNLYPSLVEQDLQTYEVNKEEDEIVELSELLW